LKNTIPHLKEHLSRIAVLGFMKFTKKEILDLDRFYRGNLINSITGIKSLHLLGSQDEAGKTNLALFSQVIHMGADPALMGILFRPVMPGMHSLSNIEKTGFFTLNHVLESMLSQAHWTSAKWEQSEFEKVGLQAEYLDDFPAPFVKESALKIGLSFAEKTLFPINGTTFVIGRIENIWIPEGALAADGFVNLEKAGTMACGGLDSYYAPRLVSRFAYAKAEKIPELI
jgi:flavin reductase (DIM6/NTAB) family NADH-FMN oxidoreductase RutF